MTFASAQASVGWHAHPDVWAVMVALLGGYIAAVTLLGPRLADPDAPIATTRQKACFFAGVLVLWVAADWPIHDISENFLFSVHMVQHTLFSLVAPPLLLLGLPPWLVRSLVAPRRLHAVVRFVTRPLFALLLFNAVIAITHWPTIVNLALEEHPIHLLVHVVLVGSALIMWWPVVEPLPEWKALSEPGKMLYLFAQSILPTVPASFLTFSSTPLYRFYADAPRLWGLGVVVDQRIAGLIMKIGGGLILWSIIGVIFFRWHAKEEAQTDEELTWDDFERELQAWDMRK
jgi:putative membrane protein